MESVASFEDTKITFVHTLPQLEEVFQALGERYLPGAHLTHKVDQEFYDAEFEVGELNIEQQHRLVDYLNGVPNEKESYSIVTCSFLGKYVDQLKPHARRNWIRIDEEMCRQAFSTGTHIGVLSTGAESADSTIKLLERLAQELNVKEKLSSIIIEEAFEALQNGDFGRHTSLIIEKIEHLEIIGVDAIVLSQASMARALLNMASPPVIPTFTSPEISIASLRNSVLAQRDSVRADV